MIEGELGYLAGFFDGEGNISVNKRKPTYRNPWGQYALQLTVVQVSDVPLIIFQKCGGRIRQRKDGAYTWQINGKKALDFLALIYPYLLLKKQQAQAAMDFQRLIIGRGGRGRGISLSPAEVKEREQAYQNFRIVFKNT
jgi:hypothetical protein